MDDLIRRKAIIDAIDNITWYRQSNGAMVQGAKSESQAWYKAEDVYKVLAEIPSVEPEIIRCKDCAKRKYCRTVPVWAVVPDDDWYCAYAERRTDG